MPAHATAVPLQTAPSVSVREARPEDAEAMVRMVQALAEYQGIAQRVSAKPEDFRRDGFGAQRKFEALIAERHGQPVGLALFQMIYTSWEGAAALQISDLYVDEAVRGTGVGFKLVREVGRIAKDRGCTASSSTWSTPIPRARRSTVSALGIKTTCCTTGSTRRVCANSWKWTVKRQFRALVPTSRDRYFLRP